MKVDGTGDDEGEGEKEGQGMKRGKDDVVNQFLNNLSPIFL